ISVPRSRAIWKALFRAAHCPLFLGRLVTKAPFVWASLTVPSLDPSSTTIVSNPSVERPATIAPIVRSSLYAAIQTVMPSCIGSPRGYRRLYAQSLSGRLIPAQPCRAYLRNVSHIGEISYLTAISIHNYCLPSLARFGEFHHDPRVGPRRSSWPVNVHQTEDD